MSDRLHSSRPAMALAALMLGLLMTAGDCQPVDDDDSAVEPDDGRVSISGGPSFDTIQEAIDAASPGATINVLAGEYDESLTITKPLTLSGVGSTDVRVTGAGDGTIVEVDQVDGQLQISGIAFFAPYDSLGTVRVFRITDSASVLLHELLIGFEPDGEICDHGLSGVEVSRSEVLVSATEVYCVGLDSENGGTGILAQTDSILTVQDSLIRYVGSYGLHVADTELIIEDTTITGVNRPVEAGQYERDGTGLYIEEASSVAVIDGLIADEGILAGILVDQGPGLEVNASEFNGWNYGIVFLGGDLAAAGNRTVTVTASTFTDSRQEAALILASADITGCTVANPTLVPNPLDFPIASGFTVQAPGAIVDISGNVIDNVGNRGIGVLGHTVDGDVIEANITGNTITTVIAGKGIDLQVIEAASIVENVVANVDYTTDEENVGIIGSGFGIDCFVVADCTFERNEVSDSEFANYLVSDSGFSSVDDVSLGGLARGWHAQTSQGTFVDPTIEGVAGYGLLAIDSTIEGTGGTITGGTRGPSIFDIDGVEDPDEPLYYDGGYALVAESQGAPTFLSWEGGLFEDNIQGGLRFYQAQLELVGNVLRHNGWQDDPEVDPYPFYQLYLYGSDELAVTGPLIEDNVLDGGEGSWGAYIYEVPGVRLLDNTFCGGSTGGMSLQSSDRAQVEGNSFGLTDDASVTACATLDWSYGLSLGNTLTSEALEGTTIEDNVFAAPVQNYGMYVSGVGPFALTGNTITGGSNAGIYATMTMPGSFTSDSDGDGRAEYLGDCNDMDPTVGGSSLTEVAGDLKDNDCDGVADDGLSTDDNDGDGVSIADGDCDDTDPAIHPGATEEVGNSIDDDCTGWADLDGELPAPTLTMQGNTITGSGVGVSLSGATAELVDPDEGDPANTITDTTGAGASVGSWTWYGTPAVARGLLVVEGETELGTTGGPCVQVNGEDAALLVDGATFDGCGTHGVEMTAAGSVALSGATIDGPGSTGVYAYAGAVELSGGTAVTGAGSHGLQLDGSAVATVDGVTVTDSTSSGLAVGGAAVTVGGLTIGNSGASGINMTSGVLEAAEGLVVTSSTLAGVAATAGTLDLAGSTIGTSGLNGLDLSGTVAATVDGVILSDAQEYGLYCDGGVGDVNTSTVVLDVCTATVSGNVLGDFELINGCEVEWSCTEP